jgi:hypothetical protein
VTPARVPRPTKNLSAQKFAGAARGATASVEQLIQGLNSDCARYKYGCAKALRRLSEKRPELLYPHFEFFVQLLDHPNKILQWQGAFVLAGLTQVDVKNKFEPIFAKYFSPVPGPVMITAANVIQGAARIALAKPELADRIAAEILKVAKARYQTPECRNVAVGHAILALGHFIRVVTEPAPVLLFVRKQLQNSRPATRKKAAAFLQRYAATSLRQSEL